MTADAVVHARFALVLAGLLAAQATAPLTSAAVALDTLRVAPERVRAWQLGLARPDRLEHASLSFTLAAGAGLAGGTRRQAFVLTLGLGTLKELWDRHHSGFDAVDLAAGAIGGALGAHAGGRR